MSYSDKPLRLVAKLGLGFALLSFFLVAFSLYRYYRNDVTVAGWTSVLASIWLVGGIVISCLGVVGIYLGRASPKLSNARTTSSPRRSTRPRRRGTTGRCPC